MPDPMDMLNQGQNFAEQTGRSNVSIFILALIAILGCAQSVPNLVLVLVITLALTVRLVAELDRKPAMVEMACVIACLQFLVAPFVVYSGMDTGHRYVMYVPESTYFAFAIPATCCFAVATFLPTAFGNHAPQIPSENSNAGFAMVCLGFVATAGARFAPGQLGFAFT